MLSYWDNAAHLIGSMLKSDVHSHSTPLHLGFSCYILNTMGQALLTRRALNKATWPGVWTNSSCGRPGPGEGLVAAVHRRVAQESGPSVTSIRSVLSQFCYRAVDTTGIVENEICPVFLAQADGPLDPVQAEVSQWKGGGINEVRTTITATPFLVSLWIVDQPDAGVFEMLQ